MTSRRRRVRFDVGRALAVRPEAAWAVLADTAQWPRWGPTVSAVECDDTVIGPASHGRLRTPVGLWLAFRVTDFEPGRRWAWSVAGVPATGHRVEAQADPNSCRVVFEVPVAAAAYAPVCAVALRRIERLSA